MPDPPTPPAFDREAARARYRAFMRGRLMRSMYLLLGIVLLASWGLGIVSIFAKDVERLPGHDFTVPPARCVACHTSPAARVEGSAGAPIMPHMALPSCGFCHRQAPPTP